MGAAALLAAAIFLNPSAIFAWSFSLSVRVPLATAGGDEVASGRGASWWAGESMTVVVCGAVGSALALRPKHIVFRIGVGLVG